MYKYLYTCVYLYNTCVYIHIQICNATSCILILYDIILYVTLLYVLT